MALGEDFLRSARKGLWGRHMDPLGGQIPKGPQTRTLYTPRRWTRKALHRPWGPDTSTFPGGGTSPNNAPRGPLRRDLPEGAPWPNWINPQRLKNPCQRGNPPQNPRRANHRGHSFGGGSPLPLLLFRTKLCRRFSPRSRDPSPKSGLLPLY